jgi:hypothetical protein
MARLFPKRIKAAAGTLSGKNVEEALAEYGSVYGEVLLGLHRDLEALRRDFERLQISTDEQGIALRRLREQIQVASLTDSGSAPSPKRHGDRQLSDMFARYCAAGALVTSFAAVLLAVYG